MFVGDPQQLPATVLSQEAKHLQLERSLFERLQAGGAFVVLLAVQYRMHPQIREFPSAHFYGNRLVDGYGPPTSCLAAVSCLQDALLMLVPHESDPDVTVAAGLTGQVLKCIACPCLSFIVLLDLKAMLSSKGWQPPRQDFSP